KESQPELEEQLDAIRSVAAMSFERVGRSGHSDPTATRAQAALKAEASRLLAGVEAVERVLESLTDRERFIAEQVYIRKLMRDRRCMLELHIEQNAYYALRRRMLRKFAAALEVALRKVA